MEGRNTHAGLCDKIGDAQRLGVVLPDPGRRPPDPGGMSICESQLAEKRAVSGVQRPPDDFPLDQRRHVQDAKRPDQAVAERPLPRLSQADAAIEPNSALVHHRLEGGAHVMYAVKSICCSLSARLKRSWTRGHGTEVLPRIFEQCLHGRVSLPSCLDAKKRSRDSKAGRGDADLRCGMSRG